MLQSCLIPRSVPAALLLATCDLGKDTGQVGTQTSSRSRLQQTTPVSQETRDTCQTLPTARWQPAAYPPNTGALRKGSASRFTSAKRCDSTSSTFYKRRHLAPWPPRSPRLPLCRNAAKVRTPYLHVVKSSSLSPMLSPC